uniref:Putative GIY-YIG homing endonuclease n=1 Tax=Jenufa minuta TaxID=993092 RepID=A0A0S2LPA4_JENMI|nr:putative GIY-YIG homing endonuclease [Jenufa minuta]ALO63000.1 putative GIY-YIG homing endonuclease [Jenufa minuta]
MKYNSSKFSTLVDFTPYLKPGIYMIICVENNKRYYGQSANLADRLSRHFIQLKKNTPVPLMLVNKCISLKKDWNLYGGNSFKFQILHIGSFWSDEQVQLKKEQQLIDQHPQLTYNRTDCVVSNNYKIICEIYDKIYNSIGEASRCLNLSESEIRRRLYNHDYIDFKIIEKVSQKSPIKIKGVVYDSLNQAIATGIAKNRNQLIRRLDSNKFPDWTRLVPKKVVFKRSKYN